MDASPVQADLGAWLLKIAVGIIIAVLSAILYDMNERLKYLERNALTPDTLKDAMREVITETDRKHHK